jgi:methylmalonyl-CoA/ethylmalonyl-CoA epimerase
MRLHHVGYVVADIASSVSGFQKSLGASWDSQIFTDPHQEVKVTFLSTRPGDAQVELVEPLGAESPVLRFLCDKGGGLHHVCYEVMGLEQELNAFKARGALIVKRPKPAVAFQGRRIAWVLTPEKLLVELLEENAQPSLQDIA